MRVYAAGTKSPSLAKGDIVASYVNGKRYVHITDNGATPPTVTYDIERHSHTATQIATLRTELDTIRQKRDYLRQHVSELTATLYRLGDQKALTTPRVEPSPWWAICRRNKAQQTAA